MYKSNRTRAAHRLDLALSNRKGFRFRHGLLDGKQNEHSRNSDRRKQPKSCLLRSSLTYAVTPTLFSSKGRPDSSLMELMICWKLAPPAPPLLFFFIVSCLACITNDTKQKRSDSRGGTCRKHVCFRIRGGGSDRGMPGSRITPGTAAGSGTAENGPGGCSAQQRAAAATDHLATSPRRIIGFLSSPC